MRNQDIVFSLIVPTINRTKEIRILFDSIKNSDFPMEKIEVIVVDQNKDDRLLPIIKNFKEYFDIKYFKVNFKGAAKARNYGAKFASGEIIHFPDDDAFYAKNTLSEVYKLFTSKDVDIIAIKVLDPKTKKASLLNFPNQDKYVNAFNFFKTTIEFNLFFKRSVFQKLGGFDENLGVGTYFSSEESGDLVLRALKKGYKIFYTSQIYIYHPDKRNPELDKIYSYALGFGALLRKHLKLRNLYIFPYTFSYVGKSIIGVIIFKLFNDRYKFNKYKFRLKGFINGFKEASKLYK
jgi:GT2 family glycosyltransferase